MLDEGLAEAGLDRDEIYVTNAVKHFKWRARGTRRIHQRPNAAEVAACSQWLRGELDALTPDVVVLLGATAAQALLGRGFRVTQQRGVALEDTGLAPTVVATVHPASILRQRDAEARAQAKAEFVHDLAVVHELVTRTASRTR